MHDRRHGRGHGRRPLDYGEIRLLLLSMIAEQPRHGYDLIRGVEELFGGTYAPSPGVVYPTLSWLEDMGYAVIEPSEAGRKSYAATPEGRAFLEENAAAVDELRARIGGGTDRGGRSRHPQIMRAMENLKTALRLRVRGQELSDEMADQVAAILDAAAQQVERVR